MIRKRRSTGSACISGALSDSLSRLPGQAKITPLRALSTKAALSAPKCGGSGPTRPGLRFNAADQLLALEPPPMVTRMCRKVQAHPEHPALQEQSARRALRGPQSLRAHQEQSVSAERPKHFEYPNSRFAELRFLPGHHARHPCQAAPDVCFSLWPLNAHPYSLPWMNGPDKNPGDSTIELAIH